jgi:hypothetical protein
VDLTVLDRHPDAAVTSLIPGAGVAGRPGSEPTSTK